MPQRDLGDIQDIVVIGFRTKKKDAFVRGLSFKVIWMPTLDSKDRFQRQNQQPDAADDDPATEQDLLMEQILENINTTPIGRVLKKIASLPEVRREKVLNVRRKLNKGKYKLNERLDIALDKVLEDLSA